MKYIKTLIILVLALSINTSFAQESEVKKGKNKLEKIKKEKHKKELNEHKEKMHDHKDQMKQKKKELHEQKKELKEARKQLKAEHKEGRDAILGEHKDIMKNMSSEERKAYLEKHPKLGQKLKAHNMDMKDHKKTLKKEHVKFKNEKADAAQHKIEAKKERLAYFEQRSINADSRIAAAKERIAKQKEEGKITEEEYNEKLAKIATIENKNNAHKAKMISKKDLLKQKEAHLKKINE